MPSTSSETPSETSSEIPSEILSTTPLLPEEPKTCNRHKIMLSGFFFLLIVEMTIIFSLQEKAPNRNGATAVDCDVTQVEQNFPQNTHVDYQTFVAAALQFCNVVYSCASQHFLTTTNNTALQLLATAMCDIQQKMQRSSILTPQNVFANFTGKTIYFFLNNAANKANTAEMLWSLGIVIAVLLALCKICCAQKPQQDEPVEGSDDEKRQHVESNVEGDAKSVLDMPHERENETSPLLLTQMQIADQYCLDWVYAQKTEENRGILSPIPDELISDEPDEFRTDTSHPLQM